MIPGAAIKCFRLIAAHKRADSPLFREAGDLKVFTTYPDVGLRSRQQRVGIAGDSRLAIRLGIRISPHSRFITNSAERCTMLAGGSLSQCAVMLEINSPMPGSCNADAPTRMWSDTGRLSSSKKPMSGARAASTQAMRAKFEPWRNSWTTRHSIPLARGIATEHQFSRPWRYRRSRCCRPPTSKEPSAASWAVSFRSISGRRRAPLWYGR